MRQIQTKNIEYGAFNLETMITWTMCSVHKSIESSQINWLTQTAIQFECKLIPLACKQKSIMFELLSILCLHWMRTNDEQCHFKLGMCRRRALAYSKCQLFSLSWLNICPIIRNGNFSLFLKSLAQPIVRCDCDCNGQYT